MYELTIYLDEDKLKDGKLEYTAYSLPLPGGPEGSATAPTPGEALKKLAANVDKNPVAFGFDDVKK